MTELAHLTWPELAAAVASGATTLILPLGATEQHGPHLPLATDTLRAEELARRLARLVPGSLVAPTLPFGCSDEHAGFAGLLGLEAATLAALICELAQRAVAWGIQRLVVLSAHGGNGTALGLAATRLRHVLPDLSFWYTGMLPAGPGGPLAVAAAAGISGPVFGLHAGEGETSELLWLRPDLVRQDQLMEGLLAETHHLMPTLIAQGLRPVTANGVLGDPTAATPARGAAYLQAAAEQVAALLNQEARNMH
ncbi:MAG: mycofactocin biosynthesis peptidyl-dipeptidase MftE [Oscillochloridaceae bacterium umkhey_bin13]